MTETEAQEIQPFKNRLAAARQAVEMACAVNDADRIKFSAEELMRAADDETPKRFRMRRQGADEREVEIPHFGR